MAVKNNNYKKNSKSSSNQNNQKNKSLKHKSSKKNNPQIKNNHSNKKNNSPSKNSNQKNNLQPQKTKKITNKENLLNEPKPIIKEFKPEKILDKTILETVENNITKEIKEVSELSKIDDQNNKNTNKLTKKSSKSDINETTEPSSNQGNPNETIEGSLNQKNKDELVETYQNQEDRNESTQSSEDDIDINETIEIFPKQDNSNETTEVSFKQKSKDESVETSQNQEENKSIDNKEQQTTNEDKINPIDQNNLKDSANYKDNNSYHPKHKKNMYIITLILIILSMLSIFIYITIPKIKLNGDKHYQITYKDNFIDPGYNAHKLGKDISNEIIIKSNLVDNRVGNYQITYQIKYLFLTIKKTRYIDIIDNQKPTITIDNPVKICPNQLVNDINYESFDEYDGNLTDKVKIVEQDNLLHLSVKDSSGNETNLTTTLIKEDEELPVITLNGNQTIYLNYGATYQEPGYTALDNCDGDLTDSVSVSGTVGKNIGTYSLTYTVKDSSNNEAKITRTIIITKSTLPNSGTINNGTIYLTFDDGPSSLTTGYILDILKEENVPATFFITGNGPDELIKRMYDEGHTVGLHTYTHNYSYIYSSTDNYFSDLQQISNRVKNITGYESKIIRFPGGSSNTVSRNYQIGIMSLLTNQVLERGYRYYDWNIDSDDAGHAYNSTAVYSNVVNSLSPNRANMVLMHDIKPQTKDALRDIIHYAKNNGYTFKKIEMNTYMIRHSVNN